MKRIVWLRLIPLLVSLFTVVPVDAQTQTPLYTQTFQIHAPCDNEDIVYRASIVGFPPGTWKMTPWLEESITILFAQIVKFSGGAHAWLMLGSHVTSDAMVYLPSDRMEATQTYPSGTGKMFPAKGQATSTDYMNLHGACTGGTLGVFIVFGYVIQPQR
jgi:hypothetical protein